MRLRDRARVAVRWRVEDSGADGRRAGRELRQPIRISDADQDDGLVQAGRRGSQAHTARVRLERRRSVVLQPRSQLAVWQLQVLFHAVRRVPRPGTEARLQELQRHRQQRIVQRAAHRVVA